MTEEELRDLIRKELTEETAAGTDTDTFLVRKTDSGKVVVTSKRSGRDVSAGEPYVARALADARRRVF